MRQQYHSDHGELVFGKLLREGKPPKDLLLNRERKTNLDFDVGSATFDGFAEFVVSMAEPWYDDIDDTFVNAVQEAEGRGFQTEYAKKGKKVFIGHDQTGIHCIAICSLKRGNAIKVSPVLTSVVGDGLEMFLDKVERHLRNVDGLRKLYTHVPIFDNKLVAEFRRRGYQPEGILRQPYKDGIDMVFLGKMVG